jgi:hypothetical protein
MYNYDGRFTFVLTKFLFMQKMMRLVAIIITSVIMSSCGSDGGDPKEVVKAFGEKMAVGDFDGASQYVTAAGQMPLNFIKNMTKRLDSMGKIDMKKMVSQMTDKFKNVEIGEAKINGDEAIVPVKSKEDGREAAISLKKEMGAWKVEFTPDKFMDNRKDDKKLDVPDKRMSKEEALKLLQKGDSILKTMSPEEREEFEKMAESVSDQMKRVK